MDEIFGDEAGAAKADQERQEEIEHRIGLDKFSAGAKRDSTEKGSNIIHDEKSGAQVQHIDA